MNTAAPFLHIAQNPLVYRVALIVASRTPKAGVVGDDNLMSAVTWKAPSLGRLGYVSAAIVNVDFHPFRRSRVHRGVIELATFVNG